MKKLILLSYLLVYTSANELGGFLQEASFGKPFVAQTHSYLTKIELGYNKNFLEYNLQDSTSRFDRPMVELHLGADIPLYASEMILGDNSVDQWFISWPMSVHVLEDMWEPETAPVIDTDYRYGSPQIGYIHNFSETDLIQNISFVLLPVGHECTHLGDEVVIYRKDNNLPITRINISYEYTEFFMTLNDPLASKDSAHSFRLGGLYRISDRGSGWFSIRPDIEASSTIEIEDSQYRHELYALYQFERSEGFLASKSIKNILSIEARNRVQYGVPIFKYEDGDWVQKDIEEQMVWTYNVYFGWEFSPKLNDTQSFGLYLHYYNGINPFGQLRNYPSYSFLGTTISYQY